MSLTVNIAPEKILFTGHTLSILRWQGQLIAYVGQENFSRIELFSGPDIYNLRLQRTVLDNRRWATGLIWKNKLNLFCTETLDGTFANQRIHYLLSDDGVSFTKDTVTLPGSAPWPVIEKEGLVLYYHVVDSRLHYINRIGIDGEPKILITCKKPETLSAPSVFHAAGRTLMLLEHCIEGGSWDTQLWDITIEPKFVKVILRDDRACAFYHNLDGKNFITFSHRKEDGAWDLRISEVSFG